MRVEPFFRAWRFGGRVKKNGPPWSVPSPPAWNLPPQFFGKLWIIDDFVTEAGPHSIEIGGRACKVVGALPQPNGEAVIVFGRRHPAKSDSVAAHSDMFPKEDDVNNRLLQRGRDAGKLMVNGDGVPLEPPTIRLMTPTKAAIARWEFVNAKKLPREVRGAFFVDSHKGKDRKTWEERSRPFVAWRSLILGATQRSGSTSP
jgi:hypothetical protein